MRPCLKPDVSGNVMVDGNEVGKCLFSEVLWEGILSICWFPAHGRLAEAVWRTAQLSLGEWACLCSSLAYPKNDHAVCCLSRYLRVEGGALDL